MPEDGEDVSQANAALLLRGEFMATCLRDSVDCTGKMYVGFTVVSWPCARRSADFSLFVFDKWVDGRHQSRDDAVFVALSAAYRPDHGRLLAAFVFRRS
jgi:hypothetical protein